MLLPTTPEVKKPQLFLDLDGVLSDFDTHYETLYGVRPNQDTYDPPELWKNIKKHGSFYRTQPLMRDALELWEGTRQWNPIILTGIPMSIKDAAQQKKDWVFEHFGPQAQVICCRSKDKYIFGDPGDILVDDRIKYMQPWLKMGGVFIVHTSASESLRWLNIVYTRTQTTASHGPAMLF